MQKPANRILSALLVLVMVLSMLPASVFATGEAGSPFKGWSLTLGENIGVNFYLAKDAAYTANVKVGGVQANYEQTETDDSYVITVKVAAAQMTDTIALTVKNGETVVHTDDYSVREYAEIILAENSGYDVEVKDMVLQMLNYGAYAQKYFNYKPGSLANAGYAVENNAAVPETVPAISPEGSAEGVSLYGMSLVFQSRTAVRFYFAVSGKAGDHTFKAGETVLTPVYKDGLYYVEVAGINPQDLDNAVTVTVDGTLSVSYSPMMYVARKYNSTASSEALKNLVQAMYSYHLEAVEYEKYTQIIQVGTLKSHDNNTPWVKNENETFIYFNTDAYTATTGEYAAVSADAVKLVRGGETYSVANPGQGLIIKDNDTQHLIKLAPWTITGNRLPIQANDYFIIEGRFVSTSGDGTTIEISKSYIYYDGTNVEVSETEPVLPNTIDCGVMSSHSNGWNSDALYFSMAENAAPIGDGIRYVPDAESNIKLIRDGVTYNVGHTARETIVKSNETAYYIALWTLGDYKPLQANDILIVEGGFTNAANKTTLNISKSYILINGDGTAEFSTEMPTLATTIDCGVMSSHSNGWNSDALYFSMAENAAPIGDGIRYVPDAESNIKLIRDGVTYNVGHTARETIVKSNETAYYIALWTLGDYKPLQANDILIVEGGFTNAANKTTLNISKSYILINGDGTATFSATEPVLTKEVDCGVMRENEDGTPSDIFFTLDANSVPVDEENAYPYSGSVQLVSGGAVSALDADIYKTAENQYYLDLFGQALADKDYLIVEGAFSNEENGYILNITKTYVLADGETLVYSENEPVLETEIAIGVLTESSHGIQYTTNETLIYANGEANAAPYGNGVEYTPVSAGGLKLIRDGVTYEVGNVGQGIIVHSSETQYMLKLAAWTVTGGKLPVQKGDIFVVEGKYTKRDDSSVAVNFAPTYILIAGENKALFFAEQPNVVYAGTMTGHNNGRTANGFYAKTDANSAPFEGWSLRYKPVTSDAVKCVKGDTTSNVANTGGEMLVKTSESEYFIEGWTLSGTYKDVDPVGNIYIFDGLFYNAANDVYIDIDKTYILIAENDEIFYHVDAGHMNSSSNAANANGIYFTMAENTAPYGSGEYYDSTDVASVQMIRDGNVINIGNVNRDNIQKINAADYFLRVEGWIIGSENYPFTTSDMFIVEGYFANTNDGTTIKIAKTYIYYDGTAWVCSATAPVTETIYDVGSLSTHAEGGSETGFNATGLENDAPYSGWSAEYAPTSKECIQIIRNGETIYRNNTGAGAIIKLGGSRYYVKFDTWIDSTNYPLQAGDMIIIEGVFVGTSNYAEAEGVKIKIDKTYVVYNGESFTFVTDADKYINAGAMCANGTKNWFGDGIYFDLADNAAPSAADWSLEYVPASADNIKLIRNGVTTSVANTGAGTILKIDNDTGEIYENYWLKLQAYCIGGNTIQDGDVLVIEGEFTNAATGYTLNIDKTYITFGSKENDEVVFSSAVNTEFGDVLLPSSADTLTIGMWNGSYHVFENKQLEQLKAAGITKIMGIDTRWIGTTDVNAWLDRVYSYGISVIIDLRGWDGETVPEYADHPGLIGFLMYDEPCATEFDNLAALKEKFDVLMPGKLFYVNLFPSAAAGTSWLGEDAWKDYSKRDYDVYYVQQFLTKIGAEVLSWDNYSLISNADDPTATGIRTDYFYNFEVMASKDVPLWYTMLSAGHNSGAEGTVYNTPTAAELRWQMAVAMTYGVQNIDHYVYVSHEDHYSCMVEYETWEPTDLYYDILDVDNEYLAWDNIYMAYDWVGTGAYSANSDDAMLDKLNHKLTLSDYGISGISANENLLVGVFDYNGEQAYMVTNAGSASSSWFGGDVGDGKSFTMNDATVTLTLDAADYKCVAVIENGEITYKAVENNTVTLTVQAYEGVFVIPVLN